eukprot:TRINITY_DN28542_c0_g1_i1.p3 TRINITY_DN28542_c0_g1~~TRINITY_DN28542_c0_g1_i1.p3  ORF type:complete len:119 (+),score=13.49 TRINITY_DN28542_c0_g1_i1:13-369(+)
MLSLPVEVIFVVANYIPADTLRLAQTCQQLWDLLCCFHVKMTKYQRNPPQTVPELVIAKVHVVTCSLDNQSAPLVPQFAQAPNLHTFTELHQGHCGHPLCTDRIAKAATISFVGTVVG